MDKEFVLVSHSLKVFLLLVALALAYLFSSPLLAGREGSGRRLALHALLLFLFKRVQTKMQIFKFCIYSWRKWDIEMMKIYMYKICKKYKIIKFKLLLHWHNISFTLRIFNKKLKWVDKLLHNFVCWVNTIFSYTFDKTTCKKNVEDYRELEGYNKLK